MPFENVKALAFDVGGSIFDWQTPVRAALRELAAARGVEIDDHAFAHLWRRTMFQLLARVRRGELPRHNADALHRLALDEIDEQFAALALTARQKDALTDVWHRLDAWPDVPPALERLREHYAVVILSVLSWSILVDSSKHAGISWDGLLSCELLPHYKPDAQAYQACAKLLRLEPAEVMMVAVHPGDLPAAARAGLRTGFVAPKLDEAGSRGDTSAFDVVAGDYAEFATRMA